MVKNLLKNLPSPILNALRSIHFKYYSSIIIDPEMTNNLAEYFGVTYKEAVCLLKVGSRLNKEVWNIMQPKEEEEITRFYRINPFYIFSLAYWHMSREQRRLRKEIVAISKSEVLDYGGGIGDLSLSLSKAGNKVTYLDISGKTFEFARWLIERCGCSDVTILKADFDWEKVWQKKYSTIVCLDVIEHLPHPEKVIRLMAESLSNNGNLIITGLDCVEDNDDHPMHLKISFDPALVLNSLGLYKSGLYNWLWTKKA